MITEIIHQKNGPGYVVRSLWARLRGASPVTPVSVEWFLV